MSKPLVTMVLLTFNQEKFVRQAVEGALAQTYSPLEIIISDDASTDRTFNVIGSAVSAYRGPHEVSIRRNLHNLGLAAHVNELMSLAEGEIVVLAAGDDISLPHRVEATVEMFRRCPDAMIVDLAKINITQSGGLGLQDVHATSAPDQQAIDLYGYLRRGATTVGAARGLRKSIFHVFGPLNTHCPTEDTPCVLRAVLVGTAILARTPGILYRVHSSNLSGPQSLPFLSVDAIAEQYRKDTRHAVERNYISESSAALVNSWIESTIRHRKLLSDFERSGTPLQNFVTSIAPSPLLGRRTKLALLRRAIQRSLNPPNHRRGDTQ